MSPAPRVVVHPPDAACGRRVRIDGKSLGRALGPAISSNSSAARASTLTPSTWTTRC
ncbi:hypothetical protein [Streptomyces sp. NPDC059874]|uniref:hypothetical protein n=1 Tax=Streptomyces sp. NPDC059874 TaxID=3346983 RepID=UPI00365D14E5